MKSQTFARRASRFFFLALLLVTTHAAATSARAQAKVGINGVFAADRAQQGRAVQAAVVLDVPEGYHINANKAGRFGIPTVLKIQAPDGIRIGPVTYPRAVQRRLGFANEPLSLYEGRAVMRFNVTVPPNFRTGNTELRASVRYQSCNNEVCFPPTTREVTLPLNVVGANEAPKRINGDIFGGGGGRRRK